MSGDRLAQIEAWAKDTFFGPHDLSDQEVADVLALVEIAKAARGVMTQMDYETPHHTRLRSALAGLDSEATEGDT